MGEKQNDTGLYFTDIVYTPARRDYAKMFEDLLLNSLGTCSVCGKRLTIDECYLTRPRQYCKECKVKLNLSSKL